MGCSRRRAPSRPCPPALSSRRRSSRSCRQAPSSRRRSSSNGSTRSSPTRVDARSADPRGEGTREDLCRHLGTIVYLGTEHVPVVAARHCAHLVLTVVSVCVYLRTHVPP